MENMAGASERSSKKRTDLSFCERDVSDLSKEELIRRVGALEMEISGKDGIIQSLTGDLSVSNETIMSIPEGYRLKLENTVTEQNLTIEALREELLYKQRELEQLSGESFSIKADATNEIEELKKELERKKARWKEEKKRFEMEIDKLKEMFDKETSVMDSTLNLEIDKNHILEKQVELLSSRIEELYQRGLAHDEEFELIRQHWEDQMNELRESCEPNPSQSVQKVSQEYVESLQSQLADCLAKNAELNALVKTSDKKRFVVREELQHNMQKAMEKIEEISSSLKETEQRNSELEQASKLHNLDMQTLREELQVAFHTDLLKVNCAFKNLQNTVARFSDPTSDSEAPISENSGSSNGDNPMGSNDFLNVLLEEIQLCTLEIEKHRGDFFELKQENEDLIRQYDVMTKNCEELDLYKESVARLKIELDKIKQNYELLGKNNENSIMTLRKDLEVSKNEINEKNCAIKRLKDELNLRENRYIELERKFGKFLHLGGDGDLDVPLCSNCDSRMSESHLSPISKFGIPSDVTPPRQLVSNFTTSTPFPSHVYGAGESAPPIVPEQSHYQLALIRWMEACKDLNAENGRLKNHVSDLKMQIKELELNTSGIRKEITEFESKRKELELKLSDCAMLEDKCSQLAEELKMNDLKMAGLEEELKHLQILNKKLNEENQGYKHKLLDDPDIESSTTSNSDFLGGNDMSNKMHEIILLKGQVDTLSYSNLTLQARNKHLKELKNLYALKLEENTRALRNCQNEVERLLQDNSNLSTSNKSFDTEVKILRSRLAHLNELKNQSWGLTEKNCLAEQMQKDILALCREAIEKKFEYDKLISNTKKSDLQVEELDARHRVELLTKENNQLVHEKETLLLKLADLQKMLQEFQKEGGCDEGWLQHLEATQSNLLKEIGDHKEHHARIEEALRSTGNLHNELQKEKDDLKIKVIELAKMEKKYHTEKLRAQQLEMEVKVLQQDVIDKREIIKILQSEKSELEANLATLKSALDVAQGKLVFEKECNRLRLKHVELQNANNQILESFLSSSSDDQPLFEMDLEYHKHVREDVERQYAEALRNMKHYFAAQFAEKAQELQSDHNDQMKLLKILIDEQSQKIEKLTSAQIIAELTHGKQASLEYNVLLENMDRCKKEIEDAMHAVQDTEDAGKIKKAFQEFYNYQIYLAQKLLQDEHKSQYALTVNSWQQLHESELKLAKFQFEANQFKQKIDDFNEPTTNEENNASSIPDVFLDEERHLTTAQLIFHILLKSYFCHVERYSASFCSAFQKDLKTISVELKKEMSNLGNRMEKILKHNSLKGEIPTSKCDALVCKGDELVSSAKGFIESIRGFKREFLSSLISALDSVSHVTKNTLNEFKRDYGRLDDFLKLEDEVNKLRREKEETEKRYSAALQLLKSDHDLEVKKLDSILTELKHLSEVGCRADSLLKLKEELEGKHKKEMEELRTYFERTVVDLEKNFSEEVFSQHSRKMSSGSSCPDECSDRDKFAPPDLLCETGSVDVDEIFPENSKSHEVSTRMNYGMKKHTKKGCSDCMSCAAKVISRVILEESLVEVQQELVQAVQNHGLDDMRSPYDRHRLFTQGVTDWEVEERESSIVARTIQQIGAECFKSLQDHIIGNVTAELRSYESFMINQLQIIKNKVDVESAKLGKVAVLLACYSKSCSDKSLAPVNESSKRCSIPNEVERLLKDRNDLEKLKKALRTVVTEMSQYLMDSENDLMKQIRGELNKLCDEDLDETCTPEDVIEPKSKKHVHFGSNLSTIIQELDDTLNDSLTETPDWSPDASTKFREDIISCIKKLKLEAMALYNFSKQITVREEESNKLVSEVEILRKENSALQHEMSEIKMTSISHLDLPETSLLSFCNQLESVYGDNEEERNSHNPSLDYLQNKARKHLQQVKDSALSKVIEDILREGDFAIEELQSRCDDLEQQVEVADKQLRSTRQFLEEQAAERETERDEFSKEVSRLQTLVKEKDKETTARERFNREVLVAGAKNVSPISKTVEELSKELKEVTDRLTESKDKEKLLQGELKAAIDQVWVLRDIIKNLESQVTARSEKEVELERKLGSLEQELEEKNGTQSLMAYEIETLRNQSLEDSRGLEQLQELEDNIKLKFNSSVIRQFQAQIKEMGKLVDTQTRELEGNHIGASSNSLSSPSEEISIREHIEFLNRSKTPEHCPSPVGLPVDDVNKLNEKIIRHARADEVILKRLSDQEIRIAKLTNYAEEMQAERDILHGQAEKLKSQIAEANNKIDFLRHKADASNAAANRDIILENQKFKDALSDAELTLEKLSHQLHEKENQLGNAEQVIASQQDKLRSLVQCDENALESLRLEFATVLAEKNKLEGLVEKYKRDKENYGTHPSDLKALLADKNEEIKLLQETIARVQSDTEKSSSRSTKGLKVSFAAELDASDSFSSQESKLRDAPDIDSFEVPSQIIHPLKSSTHRDFDVSLLQHPHLEDICDDSTIQKGPIDATATKAVDQLNLELVEREQRISKLEQQLSDFRKIEQDLLGTKTELELMVSSITEDKKYYEEQLTSMLEEIKERDDKCCNLERQLTEKSTESIKLLADIQMLQNLVAITQEKLKVAQMFAACNKDGNVECGNTVDTAVQCIPCLDSEIESSEIESLESELAEFKSQNQILQNQVEQLQTDNNNLRAELSEIVGLKKLKDDELAKMMDLKVNLEEKFTEASQKILNLTLKVSNFETLQKNFEKTQEHLYSVLSENESLQATLNNMRIAYEQQSVETNQFKQDQSKAVELQSEIKTLKDQVSELGNLLNKETSLKNDLEKRWKSLSVDFEFLKNEKAKSLSGNNSLIASNEAMRVELENFKSSVQQLLVDKNELTTSNEKIREELEMYKASVRKLRSDLASLKKREGPYISLLSQIDCDDVKKLYLEVSKLISEVGQLEFQKNCLQEELARMKPTGVEIVLKESELDKLAEQISRLEVINAELKASNYVSAEQLRAEIIKLSQDIKFLQTIEQQASEKMAASHVENRKFGTKLNKIEKGLHQMLHSRKPTSEVGLQVFCAPNVNDSKTHRPVTGQAESIDRLDVIPHPINLPQQTTQECQCGPSYGDTAVDTALHYKMREIEVLKDKLRAEESETRALRSGKLDVELDLKTLAKINALQEKKLEILDSQVRKLNSSCLQLELDVQNEKTSRLHAENELRSEKMRTQSIQMENINMIENMRARLKLAMESEEKLKALVLEKHEQYESAVAKYNNVMVMERYKSESESEGCSSSLQKRLADSQDVCRSLKMELEKQERLNADLNSVLTRERRSLAAAHEQLKSLEGQCNKLRTDLRNEITKREILQDQVKEYMLGHDRASNDSHQVQSLQHECARLREKVKILQELNEQWRASAYTPVLEQLNELNSNVDSLTNRKRDLQSAVNDLERERHFLRGQINQLREERANMRLSSERMDFAPSVSAKLDIYLGRYFRAESYRKSLVSQKKYLMVVLSGFEKSHQNTLAALVAGYSSQRKRLSFKGVAQAVVAVSRMKFFVRKRKVACETAYLGLLRTLGITSEDALNRATGYDTGVRAAAFLNYSNSPPTKDRPQSEANRRHKAQTALHSDYLAALQEVQKITRKT